MCDWCLGDVGWTGGELLFLEITGDTTVDTLIQIIGVLLMVLVPLVGFVYWRHRKLSEYYKVRFKTSSSLKPVEVLGIRGKPEHGFHEYYYGREVDGVIREKIEKGESVLVLGDPLAGKSRAIFEALVGLNESRDVLIPRPVDVDMGDFRVPFHFSGWGKPVVFFDDLEKFAGKQNFTYMLNEFVDRDYVMVASCRSGPEYKSLRKTMERELSEFGDPIEICGISREEGKRVAEETGR